MVRAVWTWLTDDHVVLTNAPPGVGFLFLRCTQCNRVRPAWDLVAKAGKYTRLHCVCGCKYQRPGNLRWYEAAWWIFVRGYLWRKCLRREQAWDPRLPLRNGH